MVGLGSNLLAADAGYDGLVLRLAGDLARVERDGECIVCGGGAALAVVVRRSQDWALAGDRVRLRDSRHRRRGGAHECRRLRGEMRTCSSGRK